MTDVELTRALERCEVPNEGFRHRDHLRVACVYLQESPTVSDALARMAATLRRFAASAGKAEKYSDAMTAFWMYQVASARAMLPDADCETIVRAYPHLLDKNAALAYYSGDAPAPRAADSSSDAPDRSLPRRSP
jgi:hypothetical protein